MSHVTSIGFGVTVLLAAAVQIRSAYAQDYVLFETGQVRPLALTDDGQTLYALNTPDDRLEIFQATEPCSQSRRFSHCTTGGEA